MRWFKHISTSQNDEIMSELTDKFGAEGYGVWWIVLEKIAQLMDDTERTFARFSLKVWATSAKVSVKKFQSIVTFLQNRGSFLLKVEDDYLTIDCPNLLKYRDEWTDRKAKAKPKTREPLGSHSGAAPDSLKHDPDTDTDTDIHIKDDDDKTLVDIYKKLLADRGFYLNHLINGKTLEMFQAWIKDGITPEEAQQGMDRGDAQLGKTPSMPSYYRNIPCQIREEFKKAQTQSEKDKHGNNRSKKPTETSLQRVRRRLNEIAQADGYDENDLPD